MHTIKPINTRVFMEITMEDGSIHQLKEKEKLKMK